MVSRWMQTLGPKEAPLLTISYLSSFWTAISTKCLFQTATSSKRTLSRRKRRWSTLSRTSGEWCTSSDLSRWSRSTTSTTLGCPFSGRIRSASGTSGASTRDEWFSPNLKWKLKLPSSKLWTARRGKAPKDVSPNACSKCFHTPIRTNTR